MDTTKLQGAKQKMSVFVIAEIGINHNGNLEICERLIALAAESGFDAVKFQKRDIEIVYTPEFLATSRESPWGTNQRDQKKGLEFGLAEYKEINNLSSKYQIPWFASAWDQNSQLFLRRFDCPYNKIASAMIVDAAHLRMVADEGKHTFISTGMSTIDQIDKAVSVFREKGCSFELMHCVSTYPMKDEHANLAIIQKLRDRYDCNVGYSGHESGVAISIAAVALGATSIERHITLDRAMYGSDQAASLEPTGLRQLVGAIRKIQVAIGDGEKRVIPEEIPIAEKLRAHIMIEPSL